MSVPFGLNILRAIPPLLKYWSNSPPVTDWGFPNSSVAPPGGIKTGIAGALLGANDSNVSLSFWNSITVAERASLVFINSIRSISCCLAIASALASATPSVRAADLAKSSFAFSSNAISSGVVPLTVAAAPPNTAGAIFKPKRCRKSIPPNWLPAKAFSIAWLISSLERPKTFFCISPISPFGPWNKSCCNEKNSWGVKAWPWFALIWASTGLWNSCNILALSKGFFALASCPNKAVSFCRPVSLDSFILANFPSTAASSVVSFARTSIAFFVPSNADVVSANCLTKEFISSLSNFAKEAVSAGSTSVLWPILTLISSMISSRPFLLLNRSPPPTFSRAPPPAPADSSKSAVLCWTLSVAIDRGSLAEFPNLSNLSSKLFILSNTFSWESTSCLVDCIWRFADSNMSASNVLRVSVTFDSDSAAWSETAKNSFKAPPSRSLSISSAPARAFPLASCLVPWNVDFAAFTIEFWTLCGSWSNPFRPAFIWFTNSTSVIVVPEALAWSTISFSRLGSWSLKLTTPAKSSKPCPPPIAPPTLFTPDLKSLILAFGSLNTFPLATADIFCSFASIPDTFFCTFWLVNPKLLIALEIPSTSLVKAVENASTPLAVLSRAASSSLCCAAALSAAALDREAFSVNRLWVWIRLKSSSSLTPMSVAKTLNLSVSLPILTALATSALNLPIPPSLWEPPRLNSSAKLLCPRGWEARKSIANLLFDSLIAFLTLPVSSNVLAKSVAAFIALLKKACRSGLSLAPSISGSSRSFCSFWSCLFLTDCAACRFFKRSAKSSVPSETLFNAFCKSSKSASLPKFERTPKSSVAILSNNFPWMFWRDFSASSKSWSGIESNTLDVAAASKLIFLTLLLFFSSPKRALNNIAIPVGSANPSVTWSSRCLWISSSVNLCPKLPSKVDLKAPVLFSISFVNFVSAKVVLFNASVFDDPDFANASKDRDRFVPDNCASFKVWNLLCSFAALAWPITPPITAPAAAPIAVPNTGMGISEPIEAPVKAPVIAPLVPPTALAVVRPPCSFVNPSKSPIFSLAPKRPFSTPSKSGSTSKFATNAPIVNFAPFKAFAVPALVSEDFNKSPLPPNVNGVRPKAPRPGRLVNTLLFLILAILSAREIASPLITLPPNWPGTEGLFALPAFLASLACRLVTLFSPFFSAISFFVDLVTSLKLLLRFTSSSLKSDRLNKAPRISPEASELAPNASPAAELARPATPPPASFPLITPPVAAFCLWPSILSMMLFWRTNEPAAKFVLILSDVPVPAPTISWIIFLWPARAWIAEPSPALALSSSGIIRLAVAASTKPSPLDTATGTMPPLWRPILPPVAASCAPNGLNPIKVLPFTKSALSFACIADSFLAAVLLPSPNVTPRAASPKRFCILFCASGLMFGKSKSACPPPIGISASPPTNPSRR